MHVRSEYAENFGVFTFPHILWIKRKYFNRNEKLNLSKIAEV